MQALPNNCRLSKITIVPENWQKCGKSALKLTWYIKFRFYDDNLQRNKQIMISRFNTFLELDERQRAMRRALDQVQKEYKEYGYNPITDDTLKPVFIPENLEINMFTHFIPALKFAKTMLKVSDDTMKSEIDWVIGQLEISTKALYFDKIKISDITVKHLHLICENASYKKDGSYSGDKFNRCKKVLRQLYKKLVLMEVAPSNLPMSLERQKGAARKKKVVLTKPEREKLIAHLEKYSPKFLLFIQIFFHSGARLTEMLRLKVKDVDLQNQTVSYLVMKGRQYEVKERPIKDIAVNYWKDAINGAKRADYVFGKDLAHGAIQIPPNVIKQRWKRLQEKLGITASFYSLKHLNTTETTKLIGVKGAALQNAESEEMIKKHYDIDSEQREHDIIKKVNNPL